MLVRTILFGALAIIAAVVGVFAFNVTSDGGGQAYGAPFTLVDQKGQPVTEQAFQGQPSAVFFGFTHCPEVCPTTLYEMDGWLKALGEDGDNIRAFFVSVDPERDRPDVLDAYVGNVSERITALTGEPTQVEAMAKSFGIFVRKVPTDNGDYTVDHTASVLLLGPDGDFEGTIAYGESHDAAVAKLKRLAEAG
ncbi:MAG TPA: SCO family protein [Mesorhizobium sp.]|jgi:protein SCO1/2|nr:SCO family protein [Mesorhizobium sp.]